MAIEGRHEKNKVWCFENNITQEQVQKAWDKAAEANVMVVQNYIFYGNGAFDLPQHLFKQLVERYGGE